jgi:hypothetical protein
MIGLLCFVLTVLASAFKSKSRLEAENAALRHHLIVLRRKVRGRAQPTNNDRWFFVQLYRWFPSILQVLVRPETLVRWHRAGFRRHWCWKSQRRGGRQQIDADLRGLIRQMSMKNLFWGAPRIHGELLSSGLSWRSRVSPSTWSSGVDRPARNGGPSWALSQRFSMDERHTAEWVARQITEAFPWDEAPKHLIRDRDSFYSAVGDKPTAPASPWQNGFVERLIGSIRRECMDHVIVLGEAHLRRILLSCARYYNDIRTHLSLDKMRRSLARSSDPASQTHTPFWADFITATLGFKFSDAQR